MKIFLETTIPSYITARPSRDVLQFSHQQLTREWWDTRRQFHQLFTSQLVLDEAAIGDSAKAAERLEVLSHAVLLDLTDTALDFTEDITQSRILPANAGVDAAHIAIATAHGMDILLTWNCRHIANAANQHTLQRLAAACGLRLPTICTPDQLMENDHEALG
jgi:hypothetical protein